MSDPQMIEGIKKAVTIPVMAKARIGHFVEAQVLEAAEVDYIDESEVLTMADEDNHINKNKFTVPSVCGCRNLGEAFYRESLKARRRVQDEGRGRHGRVSSRPSDTREPSRSRSRCSRPWTRTSYLLPGEGVKMQAKMLTELCQAGRRGRPHRALSVSLELQVGALRETRRRRRTPP